MAKASEAHQKKRAALSNRPLRRTVLAWPLSTGVVFVVAGVLSVALTVLGAEKSRGHGFPWGFPRSSPDVSCASAKLHLDNPERTHRSRHKTRSPRAHIRASQHGSQLASRCSRHVSQDYPPQLSEDIA
jgi:hypothetical protein